MSGDPGRIKALSSLLKDPKLVNENRGLPVYTGTYNGERITLATHQMGQPVIAIVAEELGHLGARTFVRYGTGGALLQNMRIGDYVIGASASATKGGIHEQYFGSEKAEQAYLPDPKLTDEIEGTFKSKGLGCMRGQIFASDAFYAEDARFAQNLVGKGNIAIDMESAILFRLGKLRGWSCATVLITVNNLVDRNSSFIKPDSPKFQERLMDGARAILETLSRR